MQMVILAGGLATRLRPLTDAVPKSLVEVAGRPFLEYQLDFIKKGGIEDIVLCVGYRGEMIERHFGDGRKYGVSLKYSYEKGRLLGTAGALRNAAALLEENFFVMNGDSYLFLDFNAVMSYFRGKGKPALMTIYRNDDRYDRSNVVIEGNLVSRYSKQAKAPGMVYIDYGAGILSRGVLELVPPGQAYPLDEVYRQLIARRELLAYEVGERFYEIGSPEGLAELREAVEKGGLPR